MKDKKKTDDKSLYGYMFRTSGNKYDTSMGKNKEENIRALHEA